MKAAPLPIMSHSLSSRLSPLSQGIRYGLCMVVNVTAVGMLATISQNASAANGANVSLVDGFLIKHPATVAVADNPAPKKSAIKKPVIKKQRVAKKTNLDNPINSPLNNPSPPSTNPAVVTDPVIPPSRATIGNVPISNTAFTNTIDAPVTTPVPVPTPVSTPVSSTPNVSPANADLPPNNPAADLIRDMPTPVSDPNPTQTETTKTDSNGKKAGGISARTRPDFTPNTLQEASLKRLKQYYQPKPKNVPTDPIGTRTALNSQPLCRGNWIYPTNKYQKQNALDATKSNKLNKDYPTYAESDYGYYDNNNYAELTGNVLVNQGRQQVSADKVVVNLKDGTSAAQGNVTLVDATNYDPQSDKQADPNALPVKNKPKKLGVKGGLITMANQIAYQSDGSRATAKDVAFASVPLQAHGYAKQLNQVDDSHYELQDVMFTTCEPEHPMWHIDARHIDINSGNGRGEAYNATFKVKNTPIFYLPYFNFPIDNRRSSGVLLPRAGFSSDGGLHLQVPYYFNLAPNYDATVTTNVYSNRNPMLTGEFRYLTKDYGQGSLLGSYLPKDKLYNNADRDSLFFNHHWQSPRYPTLSVDAVYQHVSDSAYFNDFDVLGINNLNHLHLPARLQANYFDDNITALAKVESFQTLATDLTGTQQILDKDKPYKRLPQLSLNYKIPSNSPIKFTGTSDFAYFKRPINDGSAPEQSGGRFYNRINASLPFERPWGYITPTFSLQHIYTQYDEETTLANGYNRDNKYQSVFVPQFSLDTGLTFFKAGSPWGKFDDSLGGYQLIRPRLKYVYSPYRDQSNVPNFNTRIASLNYPQLFDDSWFLGYDRLADNNNITPGINYRYIDSKGLTRLDASLGQQFYLGDRRVHLDANNTPIHLNSSGTVLQLSSQPRKDLWADFDGAINDNGNLSYYNLQMRYQPNTRSLYNVGFIKRNTNTAIGQEALSAITGSVIYPINDNWRLLGMVQYDQLKSRYTDVLMGVDYESCCYGLAVYGRSYYNDLSTSTKPTRAIMAELSLSGVSNQRSGRLASLIRDRILGYNQVTRF